MKRHLLRAPATVAWGLFLILVIVFLLLALIAGKTFPVWIIAVGILVITCISVVTGSFGYSKRSTRD